MKLSNLLKILDTKEIISSGDDFQVRGISCNSKKISADFVFAAIKGSEEDGHKFIQEAIEKGARAIVVQNPKSQIPNPKKIIFIKVSDTRLALAKLAAEFYGNPSLKVKVVGITGTNGKTTVSYLIEAILKEAGLIPAVIGTVNYRFKGNVIPSKNTTPGPQELQSLLAQMQKEGIDYAAMEVSSHALDQDRTEGIKFHSAVFTNITQDHLDYHKTREKYFQAKSKLFKGLSHDSFAVINNDDEYALRLKKLTKGEVVTYGIDSQADVAARDIKFNLAHTEFRLVNPEEEINLRTRLIGRHNIYNILAAVSWALREKIDLTLIKSALEKFLQVPGRMERVDTVEDFAVFVDYAHTEDALFNVIKSLRQVESGGRIIVVFGCGGDRDKTKRPKMGSVVTELADYAIITNDNPRSEDPQEIIKEILQGIKRNNYAVIPERREAIRKAFSLARTKDVVLLAGKGHEDYQVLKDKTIRFDDREVARECLSSMNY